MLAGMKLTIGFDRDHAYRELLGGHHDFAAYVVALGIQCAEIPIGPDTDMRPLRHHAERCLQAGLGISLHPYSERTPANPAHFAEDESNECLRLHRRFFMTASAFAQRQGRPVVVNIHPAAAHADPSERHSLFERSVTFFDWCRRYAGMLEGAVVPVAEVQIAPGPKEQLLRIGDRFDEVEAVARKAGVGICWDFGHSYLNCRRGGIDDRPPRSFVEAVEHVHCHDVLKHDHEPLIFDTVPWRAYLGMLAAEGFDGTVILEVPAPGFTNRGGQSSLERSIAALVEAVGKP